MDTRPLIVSCVLAASLLAGCVTQYRSARFDPASAQFNGIAAYLLQADAVRVIVVHGMCTHGASWVDDDWDPQIRKTLAATFPRRTVAAAERMLQEPYVIEPRDYAIGDRKRLEARFVIWSRSTQDLKDDLSYDRLEQEGGEFAWRRAVVNNSLKRGLVNDCLSDPVIYVAEMHGKLRTMMKRALCEALDSSYDESAGFCHVPSDPTRSERPILIVTESLASKMVFDATLDMAVAAAQRDRQDPSRQAFERVLASVPQLFMLANQLPLLDLARPTDSREIHMTNAAEVATQAGSAARVAELLIRARGAQGERVRRWQLTPQPQRPAGEVELAIVAFTDPNDLLSYRLRRTGWPDKVNVTNALISNAGTLLGFIVENPARAHTGYSENERVMHLVLCGRGAKHCEQVRRAAAWKRWGAVPVACASPHGLCAN
ncbi:MAG: hypothetical protein ACREUC_09285, partial [Steroidobacteraceae bacterium]